MCSRRTSPVLQRQSIAERIQEVYRTPKAVTADAELGCGTQSVVEGEEAARFKAFLRKMNLPVAGNEALSRD
jgi:hypothetical protein